MPLTACAPIPITVGYTLEWCTNKTNYHDFHSVQLVHIKNSNRTEKLVGPIVSLVSI